jgi:hypothetical protein
MYLRHFRSGAGILRYLQIIDAEFGIPGGTIDQGDCDLAGDGQRRIFTPSLNDPM